MTILLLVYIRRGVRDISVVSSKRRNSSSCVHATPRRRDKSNKYLALGREPRAFEDHDNSDYICLSFTDGRAVKIRTDEDCRDAPHRRDRAGRGASDDGAARQQRRDLHVGADDEDRAALQERRLQSMAESQRTANRESLAYAQDRLPGVCDRGLPPLGGGLHPAESVSDPMISGGMRSAVFFSIAVIPLL